MAAWKDDFRSFALKLDIITKAGGARHKLHPNPIQAAFESARTQRDIVLKPRQVGLTTWELARDVWYFLTRQGARVVVVCQSLEGHGPLRESSEKLRIMFESLTRQGYPLKFGTESLSEWTLPERDATLRIVEAGASEAAAEKKGRSGTVHRLHVTELAFFEYADATLNALLECVPGPEFGSEIVFESTANGASGSFYERYKAAKEGRSGYKSHFFRWFDQTEYSAKLAPGEVITPKDDRERQLVKYGATPEQIKWHRQKVAEKETSEEGGGAALVDQEYPSDEETCWLVSGRLFFDRDAVKKLLNGARAPLSTSEIPGLSLWKGPEPGRSYVVVADPSEGTGGDPGAAGVFDRASGEHVATLHGQFPPWTMGARLARIGYYYNAALIVVERNNHGHAVIQALERGATEKTGVIARSYPHIYIGSDQKFGWYSTEVSRSAALDGLENGVRRGAVVTPDRRIAGEMLTFVITIRNGREHAAAAPGAHDDLVMMLAIARDVLTRPITTVRRNYDDLPPG